MAQKFAKVKTEHHILPEFHSFLAEIEQFSEIQRMIPGKISRHQKWSSEQRFRVSYFTSSGLKCTMSKGSTAQELFIICSDEDKDIVKAKVLNAFCSK